MPRGMSCLQRVVAALKGSQSKFLLQFVALHDHSNRSKAEQGAGVRLELSTPTGRPTRPKKDPAPALCHQSPTASYPSAPTLLLGTPCYSSISLIRKETPSYPELHREPGSKQK